MSKPRKSGDKPKRRKVYVPNHRARPSDPAVEIIYYDPNNPPPEVSGKAKE